MTEAIRAYNNFADEKKIAIFCSLFKNEGILAVIKTAGQSFDC
jgi:hypothetical protein